MQWREGVFHFQEQPGWCVRLAHPAQQYTAHRLTEVRSALDALEAESRAGRWCAVLLAYEAAPAFDAALKTRSPGQRPILLGASFARAEPVREPARCGTWNVGTWRPAVSADAYRKAIEQIHDAIARGDTYQVNFTFPMHASFHGDVRAAYRDLRKAQGPGLAARINLGDEILLSLSPELFFRREGDRVITRPMKGTAPRGRWPAEDEAAGRALASCPKNRAENVMIADLVRNDLGRVAIPGSVRTVRLFGVERRPTLWQMTSTIEARVPRATRLSDLMAALFPCGSVTGAPKNRTMRLIRDLEPEPRGIYCGALGLLRPGGDALFNVPIRTLTIRPRQAQIRIPVGSGIVWDSRADSEYRECLLKAGFIRARPQRFRLLETLRLEDGHYAWLLGHLTRMRGSARYFGWSWETARVLDAVRKVRGRHPSGLWRIRLLVSRGGTVRTESYPMPVRLPPRHIALAPRPVRSDDIRLFHKTTRRALYARALRDCPGADDVLLWNERGELTESCFANLVVTIRGRALTPPLSSGLLPGIARAALLRRGAIREEILQKEDLAAADSIELVNSVRGRMQAMLISGP